MMAYTYNLIIPQSESGESPPVLSQPRLSSDFRDSLGYKVDSKTAWATK